MAKSTQKKLKNDRQEQVIKYWVDYYQRSGKKVCEFGNIASEVKIDSDGFYLYKVSIYVTNGSVFNFDYYAKFTEQNKMI